MSEQTSFGIKDSQFLRGKAPMTKEEVRAIVLAKLSLSEEHVFLDIGAGTGSVSIAAACLLTKGKVIALEKDPAAAQLIRENCLKFGIDNLTLIQGSAPEEFGRLMPVDRIFLGGSGGRIKMILEQIDSLLKPGAILAATAITLDSLEQMRKSLARPAFTGLEIIQVMVNRLESIKKSTLLKSNNPVFILKAKKVKKG